MKTQSLFRWSFVLLTVLVSLALTAAAVRAANGGDWTHSGAQDEWEWGAPSVWPNMCNTGSTGGCWGTDLDNNYNSNANQDLFSPPIFIPLDAAAPISVTWAQAWATESGYDYASAHYRCNEGAWRQLWRASGTPNLWRAMGPYTTLCQPGDAIQLRFNLTSDSSATYVGYFVDDARVFDANGDIYFEDFEPGAAAPSYRLSRKTVSPGGQVFEGDTLTYTLSVVNSGAVAGNAALSDTIRAGLAYIAGSAQLQGTGVLTAPTAGTGGVLEWCGALDAGARITITYQATVTAQSGYVDNSAVISDTALSAPLAIGIRSPLPLASLDEDFEASALPSYWEQENEGSGSADWYFVQATGSSFYANHDHTLGTSAGHIALVNDTYSNVTPPTNLLSPWLQLPAGSEPALTLYHAGGSYGSGYTLHIDVITRTGEVADVAIITGSGANAWHQAVVDLYPYRTQLFRIRFRGQTTTGWEQGLSMDDVSITQGLPALAGSFKTAAPEGLAVQGEPITYSLVLRNRGYGSDVITVTDSIPAGTSYRAGTAQTLPPHYGTLTADGSEIAWTGVITRQASVTVTFAVDVTGSGDITNTAVITAPALSASVVISTVNRAPLPGLAEDFEHGGALPPGWFKNEAPGGAEYGWYFYIRDSSAAPWDHTTGSGYLAYVNDGATDYSPVNLLTPFVDLRLFTHPVLEFYLWQTQSNYAYPHLSTLHVDVYDGVAWVNDVYTSAAVHSPWTRVKVDLLPYRARPQQIRFRVTDAGGETYSANVDIDDVRIREARPTYDLSTKTVFPAHAQSGKPLTYTVVVANDDYVAGTLTLSDPYPAGTSYRAGSAQVTPAGGTLNTAGGALTWTGNVPARSSVTVTFAVDVSAAPGSEIVNTATLTDPLAAETVAVAARARVIEPAFNFCESFESSWPTMVFTETTTTYNNAGRVALVTGYARTGDYAARLAPALNGGYVYQSAILAGNLQGQSNAALTFWLRGFNASASTAGGVYASANDGLTYTKIYTFPIGPFAYQQVTLDLDTLLPAAGLPLSDKVLLKFQVYERYAASGYALDDVCLRGAAPDYSTSTKSAPGIAGVGQISIYTLVLRNSGDLDSAPTITDTLPSAWPYVAGSASASSGPAPVYSAGKITWSGTVTAGQAVTLTYAVNVSSAAQVTNAAVLHDANALHGDLTRQVTTRAYPAAVMGTCLDFESGLPTTMFTQTTTSVYGYARAVVMNTYPYAGSYALNLDTYRYGGNNTELTAAGVWVVNLKDVAQAQLTFWARRHNNEGYGLEAADGVFISADGGATYKRIAQPTGSGYLYYTLDLDTLAAANGLRLGDGFLIKFQNYGNNAIPLEGFSYDTICLRAPVPKYETSTKTASASIIRAEKPLTYTVTLINSGEITGSATLSDVIPAGATYIPGSATASRGAPPTYLPPSGGGAGWGIAWSGEVPVGQNVTVRFAVAPTVGGYLTNTAVISDPVAAAPVTLTREVWVYDPASFPLTEDFEGGAMPTYGYNASVNNPPYYARLDFGGAYAHSGAHALNLHGDYGGYTTPAAVMAVDLAGQTEVYLEFWLLAHQKWYDWDGLTGVYISDNDSATWSKIYTLPYNVTGYRKITLDLDALAATAGRSLVDGFLIKIQARVDTTIPNGGYTVDDIAVRPAWPMFDTSRKTASRNLLATGATLTYTVVITNSGETDGNAVLSDPIPAGAAYIPGSARTVPAGYGTLADSDGIWWSGAITAGQRVTVTFGVTVTAGAGVTVTNRAFVYNPTADITTTLQTQNYVRPAAAFPACLDFESGALPNTMFAEKADSYSLVQVNTAYPHTGAYALNVARTTSVSGLQATVWMVNLANVAAPYLEFWVWEHDDYPNSTDGIYLSADGGKTYVKIYDLGNDDNAYTRKFIDLQAAAATAGLPLVNGMLIKFQGYSSTTMPNDGYTFDDICARQAGPMFAYSSKTAPALADTGGPLTYTIGIANSGEADGIVTLSDPIPAGTAYIPGSARTIPAGYGTLTDSDGIGWSGVVTAGERVTVTFGVTVSAPWGLITNTATISNPTLPTPVVKQAVSEVKTPSYVFSDKWASRDYPHPGQVFTYTLEVYNSGSADGRPYLRDELPAALTYIADSARVTGGGVLTATSAAIEWRGVVTAGESITITYQATAAEVEEVVNTVTLTDTRIPEPVDLWTWVWPQPTAGGPDEWGYTYQDSFAVGGPAAGFEDTLGAGWTAQPVSFSDNDEGEVNITLPFAFSFYDRTSTQARVGVNGALLFGTATGNIDYDNLYLDDAAAPNYLIAPWWSDLDLTYHGAVYTAVAGTAPTRRFVVRWEQVEVYDVHSDYLTFQVIFYEGSNRL